LPLISPTKREKKMRVYGTKRAPERYTGEAHHDTEEQTSEQPIRNRTLSAWSSA